jgi:S1-C subfamily serine protease
VRDVVHVQRRFLYLTAALLVGATVAARIAVARSAAIGTGVVTVVTHLAYEGGGTAGTGMVLTSNGEILTNNHVISGAAAVRVSVPGTGHSYSARVVGYSVHNDVAVLQLQGASNLKTVPVETGKVAVGQPVHAVGNAGGAGRLTTVAGKILGTNRSITASDDQGNTETLANLLETNANVVPGDSGGPLLNSSGRVLGMVTAASTGGSFFFENANAADAYAIPIGRAVRIAAAVMAGKSSSTIHVGATAFLGVQLATGSAWGAVIAGVVTGGPADVAGLAEGDVIMTIDGRAVTTPTQVGDVVLTKKPGQTILIRYSDGIAGHVASVKLVSGPPR